jgi:hypothetical protein
MDHAHTAMDESSGRHHGPAIHWVMSVFRDLRAAVSGSAYLHEDMVGGSWNHLKAGEGPT